MLCFASAVGSHLSGTVCSPIAQRYLKVERIHPIVAVEAADCSEIVDCTVGWVSVGCTVVSENQSFVALETARIAVHAASNDSVDRHMDLRVH